MVEFRAVEEEMWVLTAEGQTILEDGSHEVKVFNFIPAGEYGISLSAIKVKLFRYKTLFNSFLLFRF